VVPITGELDPHTFRPADFGASIPAYLEACAARGLRSARLIHGKGTGTLRATVHALLRRSPRVASFRLGDENSGGWAPPWSLSSHETVFIPALGSIRVHRGRPGRDTTIAARFRWMVSAGTDVERHPAETPNLRRLINEGTTARGLIPVYPPTPFRTTIVHRHRPLPGETRDDQQRPVRSCARRVLQLQKPRRCRRRQMVGGEPIWTTAVRQGRASASYFWVGSEAENHGVRPTFWKKYDYSVSFKKRLDELVVWMTQPPEKRPAVVAFYFEETNAAGHDFGPDSAELAAAVRLLDTHVGTLRNYLAEVGVIPNFAIVSDHGMTPVSAERVVMLDDYVDLATVQIDFEGSAVGLRPHSGEAAALVARLAELPHAKAYLAADLPGHFHLKDNPRIPPVWIVPEVGWHVASRRRFERNRSTYLQGDHGYDPAEPTMRGIFIASGPSFKAGVVVEAVENIHIYNLLCAALKLQPAPNDGDDRLVRAALK